jgi:hypothetical protein
MLRISIQYIHIKYIPKENNMLKIFARTALAIIMATAAYSSTQDTNPVDDIMPY